MDNLHRKKLFWGSYSVIFISIFLLPSQHDYVLYLEQWNHIVLGNDPWKGTLNAYGPVYNFFAWLVGIHPKLPATLFFTVYTFGIWQIRFLPLDFKTYVFLALNPLFIIFGILYSSNELFLSGLILLFLFHLKNKNFLLSGVFLGIAFCFKFSAVFLVPLFFFQERKWISKSMLSFGFTTLFFYGIAYVMWGDTFILPFQFGAERASRLLSIFRFIRGSHQPLSYLGISSLDSYNTLLLGLGYLTTLALILRFKIDNVYMQACFILTLIFSIYKVGNHQYFLSVFPILGLLLSQKKEADLTLLLKSSWLLLAWYSVTVLAYHFTKGDGVWGYSGSYFGIREWIGLPTFLFQTIFLISLIKFALSHNVPAGKSSDFSL